MDFKNENDEAGLTAYMSDRYYYAICVKRKNNENYIVLRKKIADFDIEETAVLLEDDHVVLGIEADEKMYKFYFKDSKNKNGLLEKLNADFWQVKSLQLLQELFWEFMLLQMGMKKLRKYVLIILNMVLYRLEIVLSRG